MRRMTRDAAPIDYRAAISSLCREDLAGCNLIVASNRGPVEFRRDPKGRLSYRRGQGGLVTAMRSMVEVLDTTWVASPLSEDDARAHREAGGNLTVPMGDKRLRLAFVPSDPACFSAYYDDVSNSLLWFLQHGITNAPEHPEFDEKAWKAWEAYRQVNLSFARAIADEAERSKARPVVLVQDYHLYLVPLFLRRLLPEAFIQHFTHIAWPGSDAWRQLPAAIREELFKSLLSCEIIGFHTPRYVKNFCLTCEDLLGVEADPQAGRLSYQGREVAVRAYPISIDPDELSRFAASSEVAAEERRLVEGRIDQTLNLVQVARTDPSKNILRSLKAFELFLDQHPQYHGKVRFWGVLPASRQGAKGYRDYLDRLKATSEAINRRFKRWGWEPIAFTYENHYARAIAVMKHYDVLLVNSLADGMNLVAKEGPIVNQRAGVLLLSETAGACEELSDGALCLSPYDLVGMADALKQALTMPLPQRERLHGVLRRQIRANPVFRWVYAQLADIAEAAAMPRARYWVAGPWLPAAEPARRPLGKERSREI